MSVPEIDLKPCRKLTGGREERLETMGEAGVELARDSRSAGDMPAGKDPTCACAVAHVRYSSTEPMQIWMQMMPMQMPMHTQM